MIKIKQYTLLFIVGLLSLSSILTGSLTTSDANALSGSDFQAGRIIDDSIFYNPNTMSTSEIQSFLNAKVPTCDTNGTQPYAGTTRGAYATSKGYPPPFRCLKDYFENTTTKENNLEGRSNPAGSISAAQIIKDVASQYGINPKALIVLLEKEQALITDDWPWTIQYKTATGYGCPDTAPCDSEYFGFYNQVSNAARQFKLYAANPSNYNFVAGYQNYIQWNPNASCGGSNVFIHNQATAGLYNYTPYQPNSAALNNLRGNGDNCSAYGNRNFWRLFNEWFGSTVESTDALDHSEIQNRSASLNFEAQEHTFYYGSYQRVLKLDKVSSSGGVTTETLDGDSTKGLGRINASLGSSVTATEFKGTLQAFYYDRTHGDLRHAWYSSGQWNFETLDGSTNSISKREGNFGINPTAVTYGDTLQVFYYDRVEGNLRHAWSDVNGWHFENLDGDKGSIGGFGSDVGLNSKVTQYGDTLQLFYYDKTYGNLRHGWITPTGGWYFENLDGDKGSIGGFGSDVGGNISATQYGDTLQLFYYDKTYGNLRHGWITPTGGWYFENLDGDKGSIGGFGSDVGGNISATQYGDTLQLFYYDKTYGNLRHGWITPTGGWYFENLDGDKGSIGRYEGLIGVNPSTCACSNSSLHVNYYDVTQGVLRRATLKNTSWSFVNGQQKVVY